MNKSIAPLLILLVTCLVSNNILTLVNGDHDIDNVQIQTVCRYREQYKKNALVPEDFLDWYSSGHPNSYSGSSGPSDGYWWSPDDYYTSSNSWSGSSGPSDDYYTSFNSWSGSSGPSDGKYWLSPARGFTCDSLIGHRFQGNLTCDVINAVAYYCCGDKMAIDGCSTQEARPYQCPASTNAIAVARVVARTSAGATAVNRAASSASAHESTSRK